MGYVEIRDLESGKVVVLGDANQYKRQMGLPHKHEDRHVSQEELDEIDRTGE